MGGINFAWLAVWVPSPVANCRFATFFQALSWSRRAWGRGVRAVPRLCVLHPGICLTTEENHGKPQGSRKALGWSAKNAIRFVDLAIAGDDIDWPAGPCRLWLSRQATGSTLGQLKYLPSCLTSSPHQLPLSQSSQSGLWCGRQTAEHPDPRVSACYLRTRGTCSKAKPLGM